jgi:hypothetical protein
MESSRIIEACMACLANGLAVDIPNDTVGVEGADADRSGRILVGGIDANLRRARDTGFAVVACNNCEKSSGKVAGVGGGRIGIVSWDFLQVGEIHTSSQTELKNHLLSELSATAYTPKVAQDIPSMA